LGRGDGFVVHAQADGQILGQILPGARYVVTPHPTYAPLADTEPSPLPVSLPDDRPLLLFAGFVRPYKGLDILLDALPAVLAQIPVHLLVAGEFWQGSELYREQIDWLGIGDAVTILDAYLPNELLAACIRRADVVVLPYRSATQSGIIQLAFGQGTPVITTDVGGLAEVVADGRTGLVAPPENPSALAAVICRFLEDGLGEVMRENVREGDGRFSWEKLIHQLQILERNERGKTSTKI